MLAALYKRAYSFWVFSFNIMLVFVAAASDKNLLSLIMAASMGLFFQTIMLTSLGDTIVIKADKIMQGIGI
ncbi:hypothetical protein MFMK1_002924 [Metallumcola ferriviriculae]|uniref:MFS transporter n=1 Tax=Metallumcola ferriviriculae TaxID=3039180 RepID=A0AAU0US73_9FIRM|nr:hypothetical protein MFMK1_002924 [Desulfitibacteraceae bacterium MK1]